MMVRLVALSVVVFAVPAMAQVGHAPGRSPYRPLLHRQTVTATVGQFSGDAGRAGVGPTSARTFGLRYEMRLGGPTDLVASFAFADAERAVVDPTVPTDVRVSGPLGQSVYMADLGLMFNLTGTKSWRRLVPFLGAAFGLASGQATSQDSSGYQFGTRFTIQPGAGIKFYPSRQTYVRLEARNLMWRLRYPVSFLGPPPEQPNLEPVLPANSGDGDWVHQLYLTLGIGLRFRL